MAHTRSVSLGAGVSLRTVFLSVLASAAGLSCSAPPGSEGPDFSDPPPFIAPTGSAGTVGNNPAPPASGTGGTGSALPPGEGNPNVQPPANGTGGTGATPVGTGRSAQIPAGGSAGAAPVNGAAGAGMTVPDPNNPGTLPVPPGEAFFFDDFEGGAAGQQPAAWDSWINYSNEAGNTLAGAQYALLDNTDSFRGNQSVHFHATGATQPAMLTMTLPANMTRIYIRAYVKTSVQIGNQTPDQQSNHETLMGLRATPNDGNFEIRFGGAKGALGYNMVGPGRSDAVAPGQALWGSAPAITTNEWHCVELAFINDTPASPQARASVDSQEVRAVTAIGDWHVPLSGEGTTWLNGMFKEVMIGWQSFSPAPANDVWMDDVVLSASPIGCD
jgi:Cip1-like, core domain